MTETAPREVGRRASSRINDLLDDWVPPRIRDSRPFAALARWLYRGTTVDITEFKDRAHYLDPGDYAAFYAGLDPRFHQGDTDLTPGSFAAVVDSIVGDRVLDVACGDGLLTQRLGESTLTVGVDVYVNPTARGRTRRLAAADLERLPFADGAFDTVVSTHTLEHVQHLPAAIDELRRLAARRLVIVVPRQRPYRVTFNPHIHFFPYEFSLLAFTGTEHPHTLRLVDRDWLYVEERAAPAG
jgi:SAM-dependent methyltransferase